MTSFLRAARRISSSEPFLYSNSLEQLCIEGRVGWKGGGGFMFLIQGVVRQVRGVGIQQQFGTSEL